MNTKTLYAITVDTEEEWEWDAGLPTTGMSVANILRLPRFQDLCSRFGVATTYFANWAVLRDRQACGVLLDLAQREGVEVGMHIHPWNTPPLDQGGAAGDRESFLHNLPCETIRNKLSSVHELFLKNGLRPTSFRGGRFSSGGVIHQFLRDQGFLADSSVVPYTTWSSDGAPDYRGRGPKPIRHPPRCEGDLPFWEIPLTCAFTRRPAHLWQRAYELCEGTWLGKLHLIGIADRLGIVSRIGLNFESTETTRMLRLLRQLRRERPPCLCFTVHSTSLVAGAGTPYTRTQDQENRLFGRLEEVLGTLADWDEFRPATVTGIARTLEEQYQRQARPQPLNPLRSSQLTR
jgi:hypothetical protein